MVIVMVLVPPDAMLVGLKAFVVMGGATTIRVAEAAPPVTVGKTMLPSSKTAVTGLVVLSLKPALVPVTSTENEQLLFAPKTNDVILIVLPPGLAIIVAAQSPVKALGAATSNPLGNVSLKETFNRSVLAFGLVKAKVSDVLPFSGMVAAPKDLVAVGGSTVGAAFTVRVAVLLVVPAPLSLAEIGPVVLFFTPVVVACTNTEIKHAPLAMSDRMSPFGVTSVSRTFGVILNGTAVPIVPPDRLIEEEPGSAVTVPPQSFDSWLGEATTTPAGKLSVN